MKMKQTKNLIELQGEMDKSTIIVRDINFPLSIIYRKGNTHKKDNAISFLFSPHTSLDPIIRFLCCPPGERKESRQSNIVKAISSIRKTKHL